MEEHVRINHFRNHYEVSKGGDSVHLCDPFEGIRLEMKSMEIWGPLRLSLHAQMNEELMACVRE